MLYYTAEIRWFHNETIPDDVHDWFGTADLPTPETRTDDYLLLPGWESVGVKRRGPSRGRNGSFEVKAIKGMPEIVRFGDNIQGRTDTWVKWSNWDDSLQDWLRTLTESGDTWVSVAKTRWLRKISLDSDTPEEVPGDTYPDRVCTVELSQVVARGHTYWSVALEGSGSPDTVRSNLEQAAMWFFQQKPIPFDLTLPNAYAYPTWLNTI